MTSYFYIGAAFYKMKKAVFCGLLVSLYLILLPEASNLSAGTYCVSEKSNCNASLNDSCVLCRPLMWFVDRTQTIPNDSTIIFLPGNHSLNSSKDEAHINFEDKLNLTLRGIRSANKTSTVVCSGVNSGFFFLSSSNIAVQQLSFQDCGATNRNGLSGAIFFNGVHTILVIQVKIRNSKGFGLHINNSYGNIAIIDSHFAGNNRYGKIHSISNKKNSIS